MRPVSCLDVERAIAAKIAKYDHDGGNGQLQSVGFCPVPEVSRVEGENKEHARVSQSGLLIRQT